MKKSEIKKLNDLNKSLLEKKGIIFDIQKFSIQDGPGIRTTVFLKGCPLSCNWCHNPESISNKFQLRYEEEKCINCLQCMEICKYHFKYGNLRSDFELDDNNSDLDYKKIKERCNHCFNCADKCPTGALSRVGREINVEKVLAEVIKDKVFYDQSKGGLTLSGGEATQQIEFAKNILKGAKALGVNTVLDTSGYVKWNELKKIIPYLDLVLYDLKHLDNLKHIEATGVSNEVILKNLLKLDKSNIPIWIRIPVIPGYNDDYENIKKTALFISRIENIKKIELLAYHKLGVNKYKQLNTKYKLKNIEPPSKEKLEKLYKTIRKYS